MQFLDSSAQWMTDKHFFYSSLLQLLKYPYVIIITTRHILYNAIMIPLSLFLFMLLFSRLCSPFTANYSSFNKQTPCLGDSIVTMRMNERSPSKHSQVVIRRFRMKSQKTFPLYHQLTSSSSPLQIACNVSRKRNILKCECSSAILYCI